MAFDKNKLIAEAQKLVERGALDKAIKLYLEVVEDNPRDIRIWLKIGDLQTRRGEKQLATEAYLKVADTYTEQGFYLKAVAVYKQILKVDPSLVEVNLRLAELYRHLGLLSDAMQQYETIANSLAQQGRTREALAAMRQIVDLDPENVASRIKLAEQFSREGQSAEAIEEFSRAVDYLRVQDRTDDFVKVAERLLTLDAANHTLAKELARILLGRGEVRRALARLQPVFTADPRDEETLALLVDAFEALGQTQKAVQVLKELARIFDEAGNREGRNRLTRRIQALESAGGGARPLTGEVRGFTPPPLSHAVSPRIPARVPGPTPAPLRAAVTPGPARPAVTPGPTRAAVAPPSDRGATPAPAIPRVPTPGARLPTRTPTPIDAPSVAPSPSSPRPAPPIPPPSPSRPTPPPAPQPVQPAPSAAASARARAAGDDDLPLLEPEIPEMGTHDEVVLDEADIEEEHSLSAPAVDVHRILTEADVYLKYGLHDRAIEHLKQIFEHVPEHLEARERLKNVYVAAGRHVEAARELVTIAERLALDDPAQAVERLREALDLEHGNRAARRLLDSLAGRGPRSEPAAPGGRPPARASGEAAGPGRSSSPSGTDFPASLLPTDLDLKELAPTETPALRQESPSAAPAPAPAAPAGPPAGAADAFELKQPTVPRPPDTAVDLSDDLVEANFYLQHDAYDDARSLLEGLLAHYPGHPAVLEKLAEVERRAAADADAAPPAPAPEPPPAALPPMDLELIDEATPSPREIADTDAHYDLAVDYRRAGRWDDAIREFNLARDNPERAVLCQTMIGLCWLAKGQVTEAINEFKKTLFLESISPREKLAVYYELGHAYERLGDAREALYYYEKVDRQQPGYRDVKRRIAALRSGGGEGGASDDSEVDDAFERILGGVDSGSRSERAGPGERESAVSAPSWSAPSFD